MNFCHDDTWLLAGIGGLEGGHGEIGIQPLPEEGGQIAVRITSAEMGGWCPVKCAYMCVYIWNGYIQEFKFIEFVFIIPIALGLIF